MINKTPTPHSTLLRAKDIATKMGINYCYVGNVNDIKINLHTAQNAEVYQSKEIKMKQKSLIWKMISV